jgi:regulation of enolase protein 1 (concanavalin A-like superfamily)
MAVWRGSPDFRAPEVSGRRRVQDMVWRTWQTATMSFLVLPGFPFPLEYSGNPPLEAELAGASLKVAAAAGTDLFIDPAADGTPPPDAGRLTGLPADRDFTLSARVSVDFGSVFDAGALLLHVTEHRWAKVCYELSPQRRPTAVAVVTRTTSDDSHSFATQGEPLWLRITRKGRAWAFHASQDSDLWHLLRYFTLGEASGARVGFMAQSPKGWGCTAVFDQIAYRTGSPSDLRDGS